MRNTATKTYHVLSRLRARTRILLSGTPIHHNVQDLHTLLEFACPGLLPSLRDFQQACQVPIERLLSQGATSADDDAPEAVRQLRKDIAAHVLRRTKAQVQ